MIILKPQSLQTRTMATQQQPQPIETRVTNLELQLTQIQQLLATLTPPPKPWWEQITGSHANDPTFETAMQLGQQWRKTAP
ncbi:hypothetical protein VB712_20205 [Spirulina sp. CCNP1310]|uniref:hypothetical protein n=1 Tax=Spirulina sp. CCNP1310 TaxID=3110249 RepID=UPI002B214DD7|nr:hypothetical protein [Spirulina sp. CCNP1310]MEA5421552.1 hypothetical protein [Spirulina sp. CCNP1310]